MQDKQVLPYAPILVESTRAIGYSFESALADIIDNSIGKGAREIHVRFDSTDPKYIAVIDDAVGMNEEELLTAMRYGSRSAGEERDEMDLGRFGLGLKTASLSQCKTLTVVTKQGKSLLAAQWDLDHIVETGDWILRWFSTKEIESIPFVDELKQNNTGTIVLWQNFDRMLNGASDEEKLFDEKISLAREHISLVFHRYMGNESINDRLHIYFNNNKIEPKDPFLTSNPGTQPLMEQTIEIAGSEIKVKPFVLPYISKLSSKDKKTLGDISDLRQNQGFYVYRNKRLIIWGTWFRLIKQHELNKLARVRVDIPNTLDSIWEIDIKKSTASLPDVIKKNLVSIVQNAVGRSERVYKYRGRKVKEDDIEHIWDVIDDRGSIQYQINRSISLVKQVEESLSEEGQGYFDSLIQLVENTFPFGDVYYRIAKNDDSINRKALEFDEAYKIGVDMIESTMEIDPDNVSSFIDNLDKIDFFIQYPDVVKKLREDYLDD